MFKQRVLSIVTAGIMAASFIPFSSFTGAGGIMPGTVYAQDGYTIPDLSIDSKDIPDLDCFRFTADMGAGINLGNTLDAVDDGDPKGEANLYLESAWVGVETTKAMIDNIKMRVTRQSESLFHGTTMLMIISKSMRNGSTESRKSLIMPLTTECMQ